MPRFLETKLKQEYGARSATPYKVMNKLGYMHGNKETPAGAAAQAKHENRYGAAAKPPAMKNMASSLPHPHRNLQGYLHPKKSR